MTHFSVGGREEQPQHEETQERSPSETLQHDGELENSTHVLDDEHQTSGYHTDYHHDDLQYDADLRLGYGFGHEQGDEVFVEGAREGVHAR